MYFKKKQNGMGQKGWGGQRERRAARRGLVGLRERKPLLAKEYE